jgi:hypothetical protein
MHLLVDPVVLCFCEDLPRSITPLGYLDYLTRWRNFIVHGPGGEFRISNTCDLALHNQDCFLDPIRLKCYFRSLPSVGRLPVNTIPPICDPILQWYHYNWTRFDANVPHGHITLTPDLCTRIPNQAIADSLRETLGYIAWDRYTTNDLPEDLYLLTHPIGYEEIQIEVNVHGTVTRHDLPIKVP